MSHETIWPVTDNEDRAWSMACYYSAPEDERGHRLGLEVWPACHGTDRGEKSHVPTIGLTYTEALVLGMLAIYEPIEEPDDIMPQLSRCLLTDLCDKSPALRQHLEEMWAGRRTK